MCGIAGYIGKLNTEKTLIEMLKHLEYRGYDSAGIAVIKNNSISNQANYKIEVTKTKGKIASLEKLLRNANKIPPKKIILSSNDLTPSNNKNLQNKLNTFNEKQKQETDLISCGIAHTRWATHGEASTLNAHPHLSSNNKWAIVHNGIIENFEALKQELIKKNYTFKSKTDSEVIANLLEEKSAKNLKDITPLIETCKSLEGSFAIVAINQECKNTLFLAKRKSPLYIAKNKKEIFVASDIICFNGKAKEYYSLNDNEFCLCSNNKIVFYNNNENEIVKEPIKLETNFSFNTKKHYKHFMQKEIFEVPQVINNIVLRYSKNNLLNNFTKQFIKKFNKCILIGCGTSYHASLIGARYFQDFARVNAQAEIASEFKYKNPIIDSKTLFILISQSGETADTLAVCEMANAKNATTIALTNVEYSSLSKIANFTLPLCANAEIAVASTKAYIAQVAVLYILAKQFENELFNKTQNYFLPLTKLSKQIVIPTKQELSGLVNKLYKKQTAFFIGRDYDYITSEEASLKLKEITYINSNAYPAGELKHGFLALIDENSYLIVIATKKALIEKTLNGAYEALARKANIILATQFSLPQNITRNFKHILPLTETIEDLMPISAIVTFQMLAYYVCLKKNLSPDKPRNLAKSVTVE